MVDLAMSKETVDTTLADFLQLKKRAAADIHPSYARLLDEIERVVFSGGKRLRPHLVFLGYGAYDETIAAVAAAHELLHTALLAHDDLIDRDDFRHGQPTIHAAYTTFYAHDLPDSHERRHFSRSAALLAGDLLISLAYELLASVDISREKHRAITSLLSTGMFEVIGGELLDTEAAFISASVDPLTIYRYKTASYSLIAPLLTGATLSHHDYSETSLKALREFATHAGIAYQIRDDILGVFGKSKETGKSTTSDLREGKRTLLMSTFTARASAEDMDLFSRTFGNAAASDDQFDTLKTVLRTSGALSATEAAVTNHTEQALDSLAKCHNPELINQLTALADTLITRNA